MIIPSELRAIAEAVPHRLLFATVTGAHLYGFPSPDSSRETTPSTTSVSPTISGACSRESLA